MKVRTQCGNTYQNKPAGTLKKTHSQTWRNPKARLIKNNCNRNKPKEINNINAKFMAFASEEEFFWRK